MQAHKSTSRLRFWNTENGRDVLVALTPDHNEEKEVAGLEAGRKPVPPGGTCIHLFCNHFSNTNLPYIELDRMTISENDLTGKNEKRIAEKIK